MSLIAVCVIAVVLAAIAANVFALAVGEGRYTRLHNIASLLGAIGLFLIACVPVILLYAIVDYAGNQLHSYRGSVLAGLVALALVTSLASLVVGLVIQRRSPEA